MRVLTALGHFIRHPFRMIAGLWKLWREYRKYGSID